MKIRKKRTCSKQSIVWDKELIILREETHRQCFNYQPEQTSIERTFSAIVEDVSIAPPMHCNYGGDYIRFGHRVFINANCTFSPQVV